MKIDYYELLLISLYAIIPGILAFGSFNSAILYLGSLTAYNIMCIARTLRSIDLKNDKLRKKDII